jgi:hypothetical protein
MVVRCWRFVETNARQLQNCGSRFLKCPSHPALDCPAVAGTARSPSSAKESTCRSSSECRDLNCLLCAERFCGSSAADGSKSLALLPPGPNNTLMCPLSPLPFRLAGPSPWAPAAGDQISPPAAFPDQGACGPASDPRHYRWSESHADVHLQHPSLCYASCPGGEREKAR